MAIVFEHRQIEGPDLGVGINRDCNHFWFGQRRNQRHGGAAKRAIDKRLLRTAGGAQHIVAHAAEGEAQIKTRLRNMLAGLLKVSLEEAGK